jgi:hypothetical protein
LERLREYPRGCTAEPILELEPSLRKEQPMARRLVTRVIFLGALLSPGAGRAQMPTTSFVVEARVAGASAGVIPSLMIGGRLAGRIQLGLGGAVMRIAPGSPTPTMPTTTTFAFGPDLAVDLVKSPHDLVGLYIRGSLAFGAQIGEIPGRPDTTVFVIGYQAALGARTMLNANFALGIEGGALGVFIDPGGSRGSGTTSVYGAATGTFYWRGRRAENQAAQKPH